MTRLLHIDSSARRNSFSRRVARVFAAEWRAEHPIELTNALHVPFLAEFRATHEASRVVALEAAATLARSIGQPVAHPT